MDARLVVIEDQQPRIGELPHPRGFLILEENEWKALVGDCLEVRRDRHGDRDLTAISMPVSALATVDARKLGLAIDMVARRALATVQALRARATADHRAGRNHAFFAILHLDATLAAETYPPPMS